MQPAITGFLAVACSLTYACSPKQSKPKDHKTYCACDSLNTVAAVNSKVFNSIPEFDTFVRHKIPVIAVVGYEET